MTNLEELLSQNKQNLEVTARYLGKLIRLIGNTIYEIINPTRTCANYPIMILESGEIVYKMDLSISPLICAGRYDQTHYESYWRYGGIRAKAGSHRQPHKFISRPEKIYGYGVHIRLETSDNAISDLWYDVLNCVVVKQRGVIFKEKWTEKKQIHRFYTKRDAYYDYDYEGYIQETFRLKKYIYKTLDRKIIDLLNGNIEKDGINSIDGEEESLLWVYNTLLERLKLLKKAFNHLSDNPSHLQEILNNASKQLMEILESHDLFNKGLIIDAAPTLKAQINTEETSSPYKLWLLENLLLPVEGMDDNVSENLFRNIAARINQLEPSEEGVIYLRTYLMELEEKMHTKPLENVRDAVLNYALRYRSSLSGTQQTTIIQEQPQQVQAPIEEARQHFQKITTVTPVPEPEPVQIIDEPRQVQEDLTPYFERAVRTNDEAEFEHVSQLIIKKGTEEDLKKLEKIRQLKQKEFKLLSVKDLPRAAKTPIKQKRKKNKNLILS